MTTITEVPFSQLVQKPRATVAQLEADPRRRLRLDRRDGEDLILEAAARAEAEDEALSMASRLFFSLMKNDEGARSLLFALPEVFPWVRFLPTERCPQLPDRTRQYGPRLRRPRQLGRCRARHRRMEGHCRDLL